MEHVGGDSNFQVEVVDEEPCEMKNLFANVIGEYQGAIGTTLDSGMYVLDINADGDWSVELTQPRPTTGDSPPLEESGDQHVVLRPYELEGRLEAHGVHEGDGNFIVEAHDAEATGRDFSELIFNELGDFEGTASFAGPGLSWVSVFAGGNWELEVS